MSFDVHFIFRNFLKWDIALPSSPPNQGVMQYLILYVDLDHSLFPCGFHYDLQVQGYCRALILPAHRPSHQSASSAQVSPPQSQPPLQPLSGSTREPSARLKPQRSTVMLQHTQQSSVRANTLLSAEQRQESKIKLVEPPSV